MQARNNYHVTGLYNTHPFSCEGVVGLPVDLCNEDEILACLALIRPDIIIHCAAASKPAQCEANPELSRAINVDATIVLARLCKEMGIKLVFTSTDLVFDGTSGQYAEDDATGPLMLYGHQKLEAETYLLSYLSEVAVCRMPLMFGNVPANDTSSFIQHFIKELQSGKTLDLFTDEIRSILHAEDAANGLLWAAEHANGLLHLGGKEDLSRYDFGLMMCEELGFSRAQIKPAKQSDFPGLGKRAADASLNSRFAFASGFKPQKVREGLKKLAAMARPS